MISTSLRSALLIGAALSASSVAPAQAGPTADALAPAVAASLPKVAVPKLLAPEIEPQLTGDSILAVEGSDESREAPADEEVVEVDPALDLSSKVAQLRASDPGSRELECLATGIYFEAKSESLAGQLAVGHVIANRANSGGRFPSSYCGVLFQRGQFSFIRGKSLPSTPRSSRQWKTAVAVAQIVDQDLHASPVGKALFFHARYLSPRWRLKRVASIVNHVFYR